MKSPKTTKKHQTTTKNTKIKPLPLQVDPDLEQWIFFLSTIEQRSPHTIRAYQRELLDLHGFCKMPLRNLTSKKIKEYIRECSKSEPSPSSLRRKIASIRSFYKRLIHLEIIQKNPTSSISLPRLPQHLPKSISQNKTKRIVENPIQEGDYNIRNRAILELLYGAGIRVSELCGLNKKCNSRPKAEAYYIDRLRNQ